MENQDNKQETKASLRTGVEFFFNEAGCEIHAKGSSFTGKESIMVDGLLVSEKHSYGKHSIHQFKIDEDSYEIEFHTISIMKGILHCILIKNGTHVKTLKLQPFEKGNFKKMLIRSFFIGAIAGFLAVSITEYWH